MFRPFNSIGIDARGITLCHGIHGTPTAIVYVEQIEGMDMTREITARTLAPLNNLVGG